MPLELVRNLRIVRCVTVDTLYLLQMTLNGLVLGLLYALIAAGLSIVIVTAVNGIGSTLNTKFTSVSSSLK